MHVYSLNYYMVGKLLENKTKNSYHDYKISFTIQNFLAAEVMYGICCDYAAAVPMNRKREMEGYNVLRGQHHYYRYALNTLGQ